MLVYHPVYNVYHCIFRIASIFKHINRIEIDKLRILDFYLLFPSIISEVKLPREFQKIKKEAKKLSNIYHDPINHLITFREIQDIQMAALNSLMCAELINKKDLEEGYVVRTNKEIPNHLLTLIESFLSKNRNIYEFILKDLAALQLTGKNGLKDRTGLLEYKYDLT